MTIIIKIVLMNYKIRLLNGYKNEYDKYFLITIMILLNYVTQLLNGYKNKYNILYKVRG